MMTTLSATAKWETQPLSVLEAVEDAMARFEQAWLEGKPPSIRDFLQEEDSRTQLLLLAELIKIDLEFRLRLGLERSLADYARDFPHLLATDGELPADVRAHELRILELTSTLIDTRAAPLVNPLPSIIGKYRVLDELGVGGQAVVYRAFDPLLNRLVAIKLSKRTLAADPSFYTALRAEGQMLAGLDDPGLVRIYECDVHEGRPFLAMEYVAGSNLETYAKSRALTPRQKARLVAQAARALAVVHRRNIIHLDIKPRNILIDESDRPRLVDFGLGHMRSFWASDDAPPGGGTVVYMPPEQANAEWDRIGPRSDLFALGGVLYFLLVGKAPFAANNVAQALERARRCDFDRTALRAARVPRRLAAICLHSLAADPADRPASAQALARDLERFARFPRRMAVLALLASLVVIGALLWAMPRTPPLPEAPDQQHLVELIERQERGKELLWKANTLAELQGFMPLHPGDRLRLSCRLPRKCRAAVFRLDSSGEIEELSPLQVNPGDHLDHLRCPGGDLLQIPRQSQGTLLFLVCANWGENKAKPESADIRSLLSEEGMQPLPWAALPPAVVFQLHKEEVVFEGDRPRGGGPLLLALLQVEDRLERLRVLLRHRFDYFWGVALPVL
jgi:hypothetical protein